ncbi:hypothetical protein NB640_12430 [Oxalobacter vibrioformis]|uniref:Uncharacterized protein n=1 Tax=Oxalobacter vibrioformis TaxID=933080 RepID=A0A9E9LWK1_9BURK|nr:hypothetical protein [Oxalobacter vibrioformis]WAW10007.1 hypothetical protein NB640_12430 [Oxalobacter vibrioformis]
MSLPDKNIRCPATGFSKTCREIIVEHECPKYIRIRGTDPNSGEAVDRCGCVDSFIPMLLIENSQQQRQTGAAVESFRNEMVKANEASLLLMRSSTPRPPLTFENKQ